MRATALQHACRAWLRPRFLTRYVILPGLPDLLSRLESDLPSALAIVTCASRSADIEQRLAVEVHGPGDVHVLIL